MNSCQNALLIPVRELPTEFGILVFMDETSVSFPTMSSAKRAVVDANISSVGAVALTIEAGRNECPSVLLGPGLDHSWHRSVRILNRAAVHVAFQKFGWL